MEAGLLSATIKRRNTKLCLTPETVVFGVVIMVIRCMTSDHLLVTEWSSLNKKCLPRILYTTQIMA